MYKVTSLVLVLAVAGFLAGSSLGAAGPVTGTGKAPAKCVKWGKKHGKRVCIKRAKPKPKPKPKPTGGTTTTTPTTPAGPPNGHYSANTAQNTTSSSTSPAPPSHTSRSASSTPPAAPAAGWTATTSTLSSLNVVLAANNSFAVSTPISFTDGSTGTLRSTAR